MLSTLRRISCTAFALGALAGGLSACGGGEGGGNGAFADAKTLTTFGTASPAADFAASGKFNVNFVVADAAGNPILALEESSRLSPRLRLALMNLIIRQAMAATGDIQCFIDQPAGLTCNLSNLSSQAPQAADDSKLGVGILLDSSGSMAISDPAGLRKEAAGDFLDILSQKSQENLFAAYDFTTSGLGWDPTNPPYSYTRVLADWAAAIDANVANAKTEINAKVGDFGSTPLFASATELCQRFGQNTAGALQLPSDFVKSLLLLSDGDNTDAGTVEDVVNCLQANDVIANVVGLGTGFSVQGLADLQTIANAKGGIFAKAETADALTPIFQAVAGAATEGFNIAEFVLSDPSACIGTVEGRMAIEGTGLSGNFSFVCP